MPEKHTFNVVIVRVGHGVGGSASAKGDKAVNYTGGPATVKF